MRSLLSRCWVSFGGSVFTVVFAGLLYGGSATLAQTPTPAVSVITVPVLDVSPGGEFIGRVEAIKAVDIRARIDGFLEKQLFEDGQMIQEGQDLYLIEKTALEISLAAAQAQLEGARATFRNADRSLQRSQELRRTQTVAQATLDAAQATRDAAQASMLAAETDVRLAEVNLGYTTVKAPITGRIGRSAFSIGNLVGPSSPPLARIVQMDPIRVVFSVSDRAILQLRARSGNLGTEAGGPSTEASSRRFVPTLRLSNGEPYPASGMIEFRGNEVDPRTGTLPIWARFPNPQSILVPGQFVTVIVQPADSQRRPMVPVGAVEQDRNGRFVLLVEDGNKVALRRIQVGAQIDQNWVVESGLIGGENLIVSGLPNARPGAVVRPVRAEEGTPQIIPGGSTPPPSP